MITAYSHEPRFIAFPESNDEKEALLNLQDILEQKHGLVAWWSFDHDLGNTDVRNKKALIVVR